MCALESANYLRNQLLRDADWAGMAHSVEIRCPLVDYALLGELAPVTPNMVGDVGKRALAAGAVTGIAGRPCGPRQDRIFRADRSLAV